MDHFVYLLLTKTNNKYISYVGYTNNLKNRLKKHNSSKGAKFTKGRVWKIIYSKKCKNRSEGLRGIQTKEKLQSQEAFKR